MSDSVAISRPVPVRCRIPATGTYLLVPASVLDHDCNPSSIRLLLELTRIARDGIIELPIYKLAKRMRVDQQTVRRAIAELAARQLIHVERLRAGQVTRLALVTHSH